MKYSAGLASVLGLLAGARAGTTIWSGSFNSYATVADFDNWSWSNEVGEYQWYIHGTEPTSHYLALDPSFKNPADTSETHGLKMSIDSSATWNSQMERCELIPQTTENLGQGELFYHFSIMQNGTNPPESTLEHQIFFFESHFTELKYGVSPSPTDLQWMVQEVPYWSSPFTAGTWFNFAYDIDFSAGTVGLWASTGGAPLTKVAQNVAASTSTNSEDFHVGILRIVNDPTPEDYYVSGVYIETGPITTAIGSGSSGSSPSSSSASSASSSSAPASSASSSTAPVSSTSSAAGPTQTQYGQCGGTGYTGPTTCASPFTCKAISAPYYYQCL
ncbi:carbohydrate-binding module family 1 protein [Phlebiopsis gigantea 11061_1 CR5-6]|uniref:Carbohydrate-binding module family 1 protein n=1 Tax=Phlebiopsis gigantea (strain 11061_1 CR5-6) TaxID=745531 RepID=A0A0C3S893_PHLG1|nr:carbohydrate-binding module family 1 protein [Phlebiopsis gigantea 11061_1 CR5-6]